MTEFHERIQKHEGEMGSKYNDPISYIYVCISDRQPSLRINIALQTIILATRFSEIHTHFAKLKEMTEFH